MSVRMVELETCRSTQDEVRSRLGAAAPGTILAVRARAQQEGRGRGGRTWSNPPGEALLLSIGARGPVDASVLVDLPRRVALELLDAIGSPALAWKSPNDLVTARDGAKVAGILVDARSTGQSVDEVVVGIGCNVTGSAFTTPDGRSATTLHALGVGVGAAELGADVTARVVALLQARD